MKRWIKRGIIGIFIYFSILLFINFGIRIYHSFQYGNDNYYSYYKNDFSIGLKSVIKDNKNSKLMFYVEDINGDIYPLFFNDLYSAKYSNYDDLLKLSAEQDNVYCVAYGKNIVPAKIHTFIDGEEYISNIK